MERFQRVELFAGADELDRPPGHIAHRQRGATARIAIGLGQHHASQRQCFGKRLGGVRCILAGHRVDHEQGLDRIQCRMQRLDLGHHPGVDMEATSSVDQQHVHKILPRRIESGFRDRERILLAAGRMKQHIDLAGEGAQLLDGGWTIDVAADHHDLLFLALLEEAREFGDRRRLAGALQACHQHDSRRRGGKVEIGICGSHQRGQFVAHDLYQGLARGQAAQDFLAERLDLNALDQRLHHRQRYVRFEQGDAHFAQSIANIGLGQPTFPAQALDGGGKTLAERLKHGRTGQAGKAAIITEPLAHAAKPGWGSAPATGLGQTSVAMLQH